MVRYVREPVLASGALSVLHNFPPTCNSVLTQFQQLLRKADLGTRGEVVAELICLLLQPNIPRVGFSNPMLLHEFLFALLFAESQEPDGLGRVTSSQSSQSDTKQQKKRKSSSPHVPAVTKQHCVDLVQQVFESVEEVTMNLVQFRYYEHHPSPQDLGLCYSQGVGIVMVKNAEALDFAIPLRLSDSQGGHRFSAILVQVKNLTTTLSANAAAKLLNHIGMERLFQSMTNDEFRELPSSPNFIQSAASSSSSESSSSTSSSSALAAVAAQKRTTSSRDFGSESDSDSELFVPSGGASDVPFCKLLFLMRETDPTKNVLEQSPVSATSSHPAVALQGVMRGIPRVLRRDVGDALSQIVADLQGRRFFEIDQLDEDDSRRLFVNQLFQGERSCSQSAAD
jgi:hypothetical protein